MKAWLGQRPWIWIIVFFLLFMGAWAGLITIAVRNAPPPIEPASLVPESVDES